jgi:hypothetical protein
LHQSTICCEAGALFEQKPSAMKRTPRHGVPIVKKFAAQARQTIDGSLAATIDEFSVR